VYYVCVCAREEKAHAFGRLASDASLPSRKAVACGFLRPTIGVFLMRSRPRRASVCVREEV